MLKNDILLPGEIVIREGTASRTNIDEYATLGGSLILTNLRIIFVAFKHTKINCIIPLSSVDKQDDIFNIFCDIPNTVQIYTSAGEQYRFSVKTGEKSAWEEDIKSALIKYYERFPQADKTEILEPLPQETPEKTGASIIMPCIIVMLPIVGLFFEHGFIPFLLTAIGFCYWDKSNLHNTGYDVSTLANAFIIPAYLYKRAKLTKTGMIFLFLWCLTFLISVICTVSLSAWINILQSIQDTINNIKNR